MLTEREAQKKASLAFVKTQMGIITSKGLKPMGLKFRLPSYFYLHLILEYKTLMES